MDPVTHALAGGLLARSGVVGSRARHGTWTLLAGALFPDSDILFRLGGPLLYLEEHRGLTHSITGLLVFPFLWGLLLSRFRFSRESWAWVALFGLGMASHILLDLITSFGTMVLYPFSRLRYAGDLLFIVDLPFTGLLLIPFLWIWWRPEVRRAVVVMAAVASGLYLTLAGANHVRAEKLLTQWLRERGVVGEERVAALPLPALFRWGGLAETTQGTYQLWIQTLPGRVERWAFYPPPLPNSYLDLAERRPAVKTYRWFARFPVTTLHQAGTQHIVEYTDLRFAFFPPRRPFLFRVVLDGRGQVLEERVVGP